MSATSTIGMDAELLAACAEYHRQAALFVGHTGPEDCDSTPCADAFETVLQMTPQTPDGLRAKAKVSLAALLMNATECGFLQGDAWRESPHVDPCEMMAIDVLRAFVGDVVA